MIHNSLKFISEMLSETDDTMVDYSRLAFVLRSVVHSYIAAINSHVNIQYRGER
jgi:hypothetical protein